MHARKSLYIYFESDCEAGTSPDSHGHIAFFVTVQPDRFGLAEPLLYFTVSRITNFLEPDFTVIFAFPFFLVVSTPLALTAATFLLEEA